MNIEFVENIINYCNTQQDWKLLIETLEISDKLSKPMIWTIYKDNKNNLLFGMQDGNIFKFNGKAFEKEF